MRSKRSKARRKPARAGTGFLKKFLTMLLIVVLIIFGVMVFFKVETVDVQGAGSYDPQQIIDASGIQLGDNIMLINKSETAARLKVTLPYVEQVRIHRQLPGTVILELEQCQPAAVVTSEYGDPWLISAQGKLLEQITAQQAESYLQLTGFSVLLPSAGETWSTDSQSTEQLSAALSILQALETVTLDPAATKLDLTRPYDIVMYCGSRFEVRLGGTSELDYKLRYLQAAVQQLSQDQSGVIDLTFDEENVARFLPW